MDIKLLEDFLQLAESGSFSKAAAERNITQPAFSRRIKMLEAEVGVPLIDRSNYPASLTPAGASFHDDAADIVRRFERAIDSVRGIDALDDTTFKIAVSRSLSVHFMPGWFAAIAKHLESFNVLTHTGNLHDCIHALIEGDCHFMACFAHPAVPLGIRQKNFPYRVVGHTELIPVSKADDHHVPWFELPGTAAKPVPVLKYTPDVYAGKVIEHVLARHEMKLHTETVYQGEIPEALKQMALAGHGVAFVPDRVVAPELASATLVRAGPRSISIPLEIRVYGRARFSDGVNDVLDTIVQLEKTVNQKPVPAP